MNKYFIFDTVEHEFETFATKKEQLIAARKMIESYKDDEWAEGVEDIVCGVITHSSKQIDVLKRPSKLNPDNMDYCGIFWPEGVDYICNYEMTAL